ncbi:homeobox protein CDX-2 [Rhinatrema bivittatum]|uniref:homeobox protein CDX-2 n=1 Tax=Rhinatrema bivittatum TaxID=194408 RepID=UPI00112CA2A6|nr:homeobox protein CDX-2 [Rhinatrema bivittatum]
MYVSYLLEKDGGMYPPGTVRPHPGLQGYPGAAAQYPDYGGYPALGLEPAAPTPASPAWLSPYSAPRAEDWGHPAYSAGPAALASPSPGGSLGYSPVAEYPAGPPCSGVLPGGHLQPPPPLSPGTGEGLRRTPYDWMRKPAAPGGSGKSGGAKTRTKDKYRVVYTDHQRLELEKEFHYSRYITIRRKAELAATLGLSERQVKIWFQNRRAKERKISKKRLQQQQQQEQEPGAVQNGSGSDPLSPGTSSLAAGSQGSVLGAGGAVLEIPVAH